MLRSLRPALLLLAAGGLSGCATIIEGTSQEITVKTDPIGAHCALYREGVRLGDIPSTPGVLTIKKTGKDIAVACVKPGFKMLTLRDKSDLDAATVGNVLIGGLVGVVVDAASGANNKYTSPVVVTLQANDPGAADASLPTTLATPEQPVAKDQPKPTTPSS